MIPIAAAFLMVAAAAAPGLLAAAAAAPQPAPVTGRWITAEGTAIVAIAKCGTAICGKIVQVLNPKPGQATTDVHNPDAAKRTRPILGMTILTGFTASGNYWTGQIYDPKTGKTYTSYLNLDGARLVVKGCVGPFCQTQYWKKAG